jgi:(p)ppGpp synthase/HD superfamily hydrolase
MADFDVHFDLIDKARAFAHTAHDSIGQKRKYTGQPYWAHTDEVAEIVSSVTDDTPTIIAAHLHDVIEDVWPLNRKFSSNRIIKEFGAEAAALVLFLTDHFTKEMYPEMTRFERKRREAERIAKIPPKAKLIKLADILSNTADIVDNDREFAAVYLPEVWHKLETLEEGHSVLFEKAAAQVFHAMVVLKLPLPRNPFEKLLTIS